MNILASDQTAEERESDFDVGSRRVFVLEGLMLVVDTLQLEDAIFASSVTQLCLSGLTRTSF